MKGQKNKSKTDPIENSQLAINFEAKKIAENKREASIINLSVLKDRKNAKIEEYIDKHFKSF